MAEKRVRIDQKHFEQLVKGKQVSIQAGDHLVHIILADIGFDQMLIAVNQAIEISKID